MRTRAIIITPVYRSADNPHAGVFIHRQVVNLVRHGIDCRVLTYRPAPPAFPRWLISRSWVIYHLKRIAWRPELNGVKVDEVLYSRTWAKGEDVVPAIGAALVRFVRSQGIYADILYAHWLWTGGAVGLYLRERLGWPLVAIARGSDMHEWHEVHPHCKRYVASVLREADMVLTNCADLRMRAEGIAPGSSAAAEVVYNGCDPKQFRPAADKSVVRKTLGLPPEHKIMLFCGTIIQRKGISELAEAWRRFSDSHQEWYLLMVGQRVDRQLSQLLINSGNRRVIFTGQVSHSHVLEYMQAADAYIQPSRLEGLSNATMEAMAVGLPVITTDTCGQRELIQDGVNGFLTPPGDADGLFRAMDLLAGHFHHSRRMGEAARQTVITRFDSEVQTERLAEILTATAHHSNQNFQAPTGT